MKTRQNTFFIGFKKLSNFPFFIDWVIANINLGTMKVMYNDAFIERNKNWSQEKALLRPQVAILRSEKLSR